MVAPVDQTYEVNPDPVLYDVLCPEQILVGPLTDGVGFDFTVSAFDAEPVQPLVLVTVTM